MVEPVYNSDDELDRALPLAQAIFARMIGDGKDDIRTNTGVIEVQRKARASITIAKIFYRVADESR